MTTRRPLEERIKIVLLYAEFHCYEEVRRQWSSFFHSSPPTIETIKAVFDRFEQTGSVADLPRSGRPATSTTSERLEQARILVTTDPTTSVSRGATSLEMPRTSYHRLLVNLDLKPYRPQHVPKLSDCDFDRREEFSRMMVEKLDADSQFINHILWTDESLFYLSGSVSRHNNVRWGPKNPHEQEQILNSHQGVMVWCGLTSAGVVGPYFFDGSVTAAAYLHVLETVVWPHARYKRLTFQHDGAPAHYAASVRTWLDRKFPQRWIGRRGPMEWPPRSPDLTVCDYFLWGYLKEQVYRTNPTSLGDLRNRIQQCVTEIPKDMITRACHSAYERFKQCISLEGKQLKK